MGAKKMIRWIEGLLWLVAATALAFCIFVFATATIYQSYLDREFDNALNERKTTVRILPAVLPENPKDMDLTEPVSVPEVALSAPAPSPKPDAKPAEPYLGRLHIPRLGISTMILDGVDNRALRLGIGHIPGTALPGEPGNIGIAGHRDTFFRALGGIQNGDQVTLETLEGEYQYVVYSVIVVDPNNIGVLDDVGVPSLTLVTCYPFNLVGPASRRLIVRASMVPPSQ